MEKNVNPSPPNRYIKRGGYVIGFLILAILGLIVCSPYHHGQAMSHSITINAPKEKVFQFLGNSANAARWSVFVNHITTLNASEIPDGHVGNRRRCFVSQNEQGTQWDELITEVVPNEKRQLSIYHLVDFLLVADNLLTEQHYESINENQCKLTFSLFYKNGEATFFEHLKTYL
ncbi:MAG: hypothetical protein RLZZ292_1210, partial [Bacteroidota bacterium]